MKVFVFIAVLVNACAYAQENSTSDDTEILSALTEHFKCFSTNQKKESENSSVSLFSFINFSNQSLSEIPFEEELVKMVCKEDYPFFRKELKSNNFKY